jgi:hypothetical protein
MAAVVQGWVHGAIRLDIDLLRESLLSRDLRHAKSYARCIIRASAQARSEVNSISTARWGRLLLACIFYNGDCNDRGAAALMRPTVVSLLNRMKNKEIIFALVLAMVASIFGLFYSFHLGNTLDFLDEHEYISIATNLAQHGMFSLDGIHPTAYRAPTYAFLLAAFIKLGAGVALLRFVNFVFLAWTIIAIYVLVMRISSRGAGAISAVLVFCYPVLFYTAGTLYPQTLAGLLFILSLIPLAASGVDPKRCVLSGLTFGLLVLTVPTFVFALAVCAVWIFSTTKPGLRNAVILVSSAAIVISAWTVRNYAQFGDFVFVSSNSGINLLLGNSELTTPNSGVNPIIIQRYGKNDAANEVELDKHYRDEAIRFITENKIHSFNMYIFKFINYFNYSVSTVTAPRTISIQDGIMLITYGLLLSITVIRLFYAWTYRLSNFEVLIVLLYILNGLFSAIFFTRVRFRLPFDLLLIIVSSIFIAELFYAAKYRKAAHARYGSINEDILSSNAKGDEGR